KMEFLTLTKTIKILKEKNIDIKKHLGQHFLIDRNCRDKILSFAELKKEDIVVEIGPGLGALTDGIIEKVKEVYGFEIDEDFCEILEERFKDFKNFHLIKKDFLQTDEKWWNSFRQKVKVIGNTPYYLSSPITFHILKFRKKIELALLTVQKEVGEKFTGKPKSKNYGPISVLLSLYTHSRICYSLKKDVFFPKPEVDSVVVKIVPRDEPKIFVKEEKSFWEFLPLIFSYRRKKISNVVNKVFKIDKEIFKEKLEEAGISTRLRVEEIEPEKIYLIFKIIKNLKRRGKNGDVDRN
ncbi:ribosomal RNA small subunit methyltransferase A, partial [bacterium]|nr:ribosomal RNA small subunit methyltransferase A [bacterium]